jgi:hypothetical protein
LRRQAAGRISVKAWGPIFWSTAFASRLGFVRCVVIAPSVSPETLQPHVGPPDVVPALQQLEQVQRAAMTAVAPGRNRCVPQMLGKLLDTFVGSGQKVSAFLATKPGE